jgi:hypothetical protein
MNVAFQLFGKIWFVGFEDKKKIEMIAKKKGLINQLDKLDSKDKLDSIDKDDASEIEKEEGEDESQIVYPMKSMANDYR